MRAAVIHRYGGPEVLSLEDRPDPSVGDDDVLVAVHAASLNPIDYKLRERKAWPLLRPRFPVGLGCDVAGVVLATGSRVEGFAVGDEIFARLEKDRMGGLAERVAANATVVARKPTRCDFVQAASIPLAGLTAVQALREHAALQPGQRVLIHAGAGGVGSLAIQIAKLLGAHVLTTCSERNRELVTELGADEVIDYTREDVAARAKDVDVVFDTLGDASEVRSLGIVRPGGVVVGVSGMPDPDFPPLPWFARPIVRWRTRARRNAATARGSRFAYLFMRPDGRQLAELAAWIDEGRVRPIIDRVFPLADVREAFAELERGRARGKIVVTIA
ncbi:MAG: NADP-dependent oxidoreductase [Deltaproteobacteria bacterium]|nr:NADP-dependent oxidoreductase [Deltaproteobacteria bacterium]MBK8235240.1 NADP-dependent oxidoreductase [Deltaproteobacteria bacterium]MBK8716441.1 NADP-dependent oxidoreductase [Deltaproteobacteria bacterium]MBP7292040.1 NADP-dependent oxidoreductase [Nannocystaceae bacterium]